MRSGIVSCCGVDCFDLGYEVGGTGDGSEHGAVDFAPAEMTEVFDGWTGEFVTLVDLRKLSVGEFGAQEFGARTDGIGLEDRFLAGDFNHETALGTAVLRVAVAVVDMDVTGKEKLVGLRNDVILLVAVPFTFLESGDVSNDVRAHVVHDEAIFAIRRVPVVQVAHERRQDFRKRGWLARAQRRAGARRGDSDQTCYQSTHLPSFHI